MEFDNLFWVAFQSSFLLGLVHGVNPCGHSWLVLTPFVVGAREGRKVSWLTISFLTGTTIACLLLGLTIGTISQAIPAHFSWWVDVGTSAILVLLGLLLLLKPHLLHHHHHDHDHERDHPDHGHGSCCAEKCGLPQANKQRMTGMALFAIGFVNMIIPCPTVAIMYSYAFDSASYLKASLVFGIYALGTAIAVGGVIYALHKVTSLLQQLCRNRIEAVIMRTAGLITVVFGFYAIWQQFMV